MVYHCLGHVREVARLANNHSWVHLRQWSATLIAVHGMWACWRAAAAGGSQSHAHLHLFWQSRLRLASQLHLHPLTNIACHGEADAACVTACVAACVAAHVAACSRSATGLPQLSIRPLHCLYMYQPLPLPAVASQASSDFSAALPFEARLLIATAPAAPTTAMPAAGSSSGDGSMTIKLSLKAAVVATPRPTTPMVG